LRLLGKTGIDLGLEAFATLSNGARIFHPGWYHNAERRLKTAQRRVSRRKKGSNRRRKAITLLARAHQKVKRQRADFHHKVALRLVQTHDMVYYEDLQTANMLKNHHLAKSISDAGWSAFLSFLSFKAACAGRRVIAVNPAFTSQTCSGCGVVVHKGLSIRWHSCPDCGTSLHRDHNAAKNIERLGQALRGAVAVAVAENRASLNTIARERAVTTARARSLTLVVSLRSRSKRNRERTARNPAYHARNDFHSAW